MPGHVYATINLLDTATHTWDLATATGQPAELPEPVASAAMDASRMIVTDELRPSASPSNGPRRRAHRRRSGDRPGIGLRVGSARWTTSAGGGQV